jgi:hypothetical protein
MKKISGVGGIRTHVLNILQRFSTCLGYSFLTIQNKLIIRENQLTLMAYHYCVDFTTIR